MRKTKIVCTLGPASSSPEVLKEMCLAGMNVARLNFSHGSHADHLKMINTLKQVREELSLPIAVMLDTKGPEYRIKTFKDGKISLNKGDTFVFTAADVEGDGARVSVTHKNLPNEVKKGDIILVDNGLMEFSVVSAEGEDIICRAETDGVLSDRKSMSFPEKVLSGPYLSEQDKSDLLFGIENEVDFIAASFVSRKSDVLDIKNFLNEHGGEDIDVIAKIENRSGVDNIDEICSVSDGIMIARGDLGVEIHFVEVPAIQKYLTTKCRMMGMRVITATEMLESMIHNPRPTRAEISDVANAVYDGSSAIMLSGETAMGQYPALTVKNMAEIAEYTEGQIKYAKRFHNADFTINSNLDAISHSACSMAIDVKAKCIVVCSLSGITARMVSRFRCPIDIMGMTTDPKVWRKLALSWAVTPVMSKKFPTMDVMFYYAVENAKKTFDLKSGDNVVVTGGQINGANGNTNTIKVEVV